MLFKSLNIIEPILKSLEEEWYTTPTPIQAKSIPIILAWNDLLGCAQTGTGKKSAFAIPVLQLLSKNLTFDKKRKVRSLIVTPTRELAIQNMKKILELLPKKRQSLFFSATMPPEIIKLASTILKNPMEVSVTPVSSTVDIIKQHIYFVDKWNKDALLIDILKNEVLKI